MYLKTIVIGWIKTIYNTASDNEKKLLDAWRLRFNSDKAHYAAAKASAVFKIRQKEDVDYLTALMLHEGTLKEKK